jgi:hypothetical protein
VPDTDLDGAIGIAVTALVALFTTLFFIEYPALAVNPWLAQCIVGALSTWAGAFTTQLLDHCMDAPPLKSVAWDMLYALEGCLGSIILKPFPIPEPIPKP